MLDQHEDSKGGYNDDGEVRYDELFLPTLMMVMMLAVMMMMVLAMLMV